tara:strand:- start:920 stop:1150 length:231 start_codon:yes stop_codon:yes gene_type:complete
MDTIAAPSVEATQIDCMTLQKMAFVYNAVQSGWSVKKRDGAYVFSRRHRGEKQIYLDSFLKSFVEENLDIEKVGST